MFTYKYRFITNSHGVVWGDSTRISTYAANATSTQQSKTLSASTNISWTINTTLTGNYKDVFNGAVGANWQNSSGFSETFIVNVAPQKRVWLEFKPKLKYIDGEAQKYFITRGPNKIEVIEESKHVYSTSPVTVNMIIANKKISCPDGAYIWKEDSNYNSY